MDVQHLRLDQPSPLKRNLAARLSYHCASRKMTQTALSERSGIAASHISLISRAKANPTLLTLEHLADAPGVSVIEMLTPMEGGSSATP